MIRTLAILVTLAACHRRDREPSPPPPPPPPPAPEAGREVAAGQPATDPAVDFVLDWLAWMWSEPPAPDLGLRSGATHTEPSCDGSGPCIGNRLHEIMAAHPDLTAKVVTKGDLHGPMDVAGVVAAHGDATYVFVEATGDNLRKAGLRYATVTAAVGTDADGKLRIDAAQVDTGYVPETEH